MTNPIILSDTNQSEAESKLSELFSEPVVALIVVGDSSTSQAVLAKIVSHINSDDHFYKGVRVAQAPNPQLIKDKLSALKVNPRLENIQWNTIDNYVLFSITNVHNNIGDAVLAAKFPNKPTYYLERAIMRAWAFDKDLTA